MATSPTCYHRRKTHPVWVGQVAVGGNYPIRVQSMTTTDTKDTLKLVTEMEGLVATGCEIIRVTVPTQADCDNLPHIRAEMKKRGIKAPIVADIHFTPSIAMQVVPFVDKVRINPGNFVDKKLFKVVEYTNEQYALELERIREKFVPLVQKCKEYGISMRVGTNHGSLSDRIMNRYGDTPEGMVESALEFLRICREYDTDQVVLSMKASNVQVMTQAYRQLAVALDKLGWTYPFHLGVTEAGEGEDGRVKSAIGIGALLEDGIGDTIRVSLTEDSIYEVPVAYQLVSKYNAHVGAIHELPLPTYRTTPYQRRFTHNFNIGSIAHGGLNPVRVWVAPEEKSDAEFEKELKAYSQSKQAVDNPIEGIEGRDKIVAAVASVDDVKKWESAIEKAAADKTVVEWRLTNPTGEMLDAILGLEKKYEFETGLFSVESGEPVYAYRILGDLLAQKNAKHPIHLRVGAAPCGRPGNGLIGMGDHAGSPLQDQLLQNSTIIGTILLDGLGDSIQIEGSSTLEEKVRLSYNILQGARLRASKTEYISCPSCGRTLFDLQSTTDRIRSQTGHLKGVKIAVMGCIVNGPGEMADADFGYVGTGPKKISLYVGKECVERNIPEDEAVTRLISLIKKHDRWVDVPSA